MKILRLSYINLKRMSKNKSDLIMMLIAPLVIILGTNFMANKGGDII